MNLTHSEFERLLKAFGWMLGTLWTAIFLVQLTYFQTPATSAAWRAFGSALALSVLAFGALKKLAWRWKPLAKWMGRPCVHGVWQGELLSDYGATNDSRLVIPIFFVIRQTYLTLSIQSFTERQEGESQIEALFKNSKTNSTQLIYIFELRKSFSGSSSLIKGSGELKLSGNHLSLTGTYWTNTPTHGDINLKLISRKIDDVTTFQEAMESSSKAAAKN